MGKFAAKNRFKTNLNETISGNIDLTSQLVVQSKYLPHIFQRDEV